MTTFARTGSFRVTALLALFIACLAGCEGEIKGPDFDPAKSAEDAMAKYDTDGNGSLSKEEVEACPGLNEAFTRVDTDSDGQIIPSEISGRVEYYKTAPVRVINGSIKVIYKNKPLADATVTFDPETFLGPEFGPCSGMTDQFGQAFLSREENAEFPGLYLGFYRVRVSKIVNGKETIPKKYNELSEIGFEAAADLPMISDVPTFILK